MKIRSFCTQHWFPILFSVILLAAFLIRYVQLGSLPPALYGEELALGYDAYSVLKTGKDHFGNPAPLVAFESFGDYKPSLYFYLLMPSIALFGLNAFAVRFPSMVAGVVLVVLIGVLARLLDNNQKRRPMTQLIAMFFAAICPWAILFSRGGWEVNVASCFICAGVVSGFLSIHKKNRIKIGLQILTFIWFAFSMYTYHSARFIAPVLGLGMFGYWWTMTGKLQSIKSFFISGLRFVPIGLFFIFLISPLLISLTDKKTQQRFNETSAFADTHIAAESNTCKKDAGSSVVGLLLCHREFFYAQEFASNYFSHFSFQFLFVSGDKNLRHSVQYFGQLYLTDSVLLVAGAVFLLRKRSARGLFLLFWLAIGIIPAALTIPTPHALRILPTLPVFIVLSTYGVHEILHFFHEKKTLTLILSVVLFLAYIVQFAGFWRFYADVYPKLYSGAWQYGYKQIAEEIQRRKGTVPDAYITRAMDRPAMAYWFYTQSDPLQVQKIQHDLQKDQGPEIHFENIHFVDGVQSIHSGLVASTIEERDQLVKAGRTVSAESLIRDPAGKPIWSVYLIN